MRTNPWLWIVIAAPGFAAGFPITKVLFESGFDVWQIMVPRFVLGAFLIITGVVVADRSERRIPVTPPL